MSRAIREFRLQSKLAAGKFGSRLIQAIQIMRTYYLLAGVVLAVFAAGCSRSNTTSSPVAATETNLPPQFAFIQTNLDTITLEQVTASVGPYQHVGRLPEDGDAVTYEFDLPDGSAVLVVADHPTRAGRNTVHRVRFFKSTNDFQLQPLPN